MTSQQADIAAAPSELALLASLDGRKLPRVEIVAYTGGVMSVPGWGDVAIDLSGLELSGTVPILSDHDSTRRGIVGHGRAEVKAGKLLLAGSISAGTAAAREIVEAARNGFPWQASVAAEVLERRQVPAGQTVLAHPPTAMYQLRKLAGRHRVAFGISAGVVGSFLLLALVSTTLAVQLAGQRREAETARQQADAARMRAETETQKVLATNAFLQELLLTNDPLRKLRPDVRLCELLDEAGRTLDSGMLVLPPAVGAAARTTIGRAYTKLWYAKLGEPHLRRARELLRATATATPLEVADTTAILAACLCEQRKFGEGIPLHREALALRRAAAPRDEDTLMRRLWSFGTALRDAEQSAESVAVSTEALEIALRLYGPRHVDTAESRYRLGWALLADRRFAEAEVELTAALDLRHELLSPRHPACGDVLLRLGQAWVGLGRIEEGEAAMRAGADSLREALGLEHPHTLRAVRNLARFLAQRDRLNEAEALFAECAAPARRYFGDASANVGALLLDWGRVLQRQWRLEEAERALRESIPVLSHELGDADPATSRARVELANVLIARGQFCEAETVLLDAWAAATADPPAPKSQQLLTARAVTNLYRSWNAAEPEAAWDDHVAQWQATCNQIQAVRVDSETEQR